MSVLLGLEPSQNFAVGGWWVDGQNAFYIFALVQTLDLGLEAWTKLNNIAYSKESSLTTILHKYALELLHFYYLQNKQTKTRQVKNLSLAKLSPSSYSSIIYFQKLHRKYISPQ